MRGKNSIYANLCKNPEQQNRVTHKPLLGKKTVVFFQNSGRKKNTFLDFEVACKLRTEKKRYLWITHILHATSLQLFALFRCS